MKFLNPTKAYPLVIAGATAFIPTYVYDSYPFNFIAVDPNGDCRVYSHQPDQTADGWAPHIDEELAIVTIQADLGETKWQDTLTTVTARSLVAIDPCYDDYDQEEEELV